MENKEEEFIATECLNCREQLDVPLTVKCFTCPKCGEHHEFDASHAYENYKKIMKKVYGEKPDKPENN